MVTAAVVTVVDNALPEGLAVGDSLTAGTTSIPARKSYRPGAVAGMTIQLW